MKGSFVQDERRRQGKRDWQASATQEEGQKGNKKTALTASSFFRKMLKACLNPLFIAFGSVNGGCSCLKALG